MLLIAPTTSAKTSNPFRVHPGCPVAVIATGLTGTETATIQIIDGSGVASNVEDASGTMGVGATQTTIIAGGLYQIVKSATASAVGVSVD